MLAVHLTAGYSLYQLEKSNTPLKETHLIVPVFSVGCNAQRNATV
jgi:hypothetical protein